MALSPSNPRIMSPAALAGNIKLHPNSSPYLKATPMRPPVKPSRPEATLALKQVIGTTTCSANGFDSLPNGHSFAFTAGAAAVVATIEDGNIVSQRFYRARPTANPLNPSASVYGGPSTPAQNESRSRTGNSAQAGLGVSPIASPTADWTDSPGNKSWSARERIKAATCLSFSPDGRFLAVGETGYKPRVLIFSTAPDAPSDTPLSSLSDHTYGVRCVAFSPDSQYLASLGSVNDGFLYIWNINSRTGAAILHSSNKCTSSINRMAWMGNKLVTVGTRHVKVWRIDDQAHTPKAPKNRATELSFFISPTHKTLAGRNCLLESLLEASFTSVVAVAPSKAIVASEKGDICLLDDTDGNQRFSKVAEAGFSVTAMAVDLRGRLHLASKQGGMKTLDIRTLINATTPPPSPTPCVARLTITPSPSANQVFAISALSDYLVTVDAQHSIRLARLCALDDDNSIGEVVQQLQAHGDAVLGVTALATPNITKASFYTWSAEGRILFWGQDGICKDSVHVELEQVMSNELEANELRTVKVSENVDFVVTGDRYGVLRIIDYSTKKSKFDFKAHAGEITGISIFEGPQLSYIACCARDRTVQVLTKHNDTWDLLQTLDEHVGAVTGILFSRDGTRLVSSSSDRTLVVRELVNRQDDGQTMSAFIILRTVMLKATPASMAWDTTLDNVLLVSTIDRQVHRYDLRDGQPLTSFRATDGDGGDAVVLSSLLHIPRVHGHPLIAGVSSTDKSIRLYDDSGTLLCRDWGHTEGVTDIALVDMRGGSDEDNNGSRSLVTVAFDGTIFVWSLELRSSQRHDLSKSMDLGVPTSPTNQELLANKTPLRRVLSQSELARFQRSTEEDNKPATPTGSRSPKSLRKKTSKVSLAHTPKLDPSPMPSAAREHRSTAGSTHSQGTGRRLYNTRHRSPSPPSPRNPTVSKRRSSVDVRVRSKASTNEFGSLGASTESLCRTLRAYRKRLANCTDSLSPELARDVERELAHTARAVGERAKCGIDESVMVKLLDQYSERLVTLLDEKISASVAAKVRQSSEGGVSGGSGASMHDKSTEKEAGLQLVRTHTQPTPSGGYEHTTPKNTLFVRNLSFDATHDTIAEAFGKYGSITRVSLPTDSETRAPKGFAYVEFESTEQAHTALKGLRGADFLGRPLRVDFSEACDK
ncbi:WD repeat protein-like protein [Sporormia fimetaria CBS 119925]|uniref:WD repeat protein-like protein n=1 Tax=Sporormia fimetaria CBS 119925 TaxID=1340428 RepID=A0A6A6VEC7_9PLEO|nr:WD repeat protein-like protein [Sporormia fimetaria CBS 119925]